MKTFCQSYRELISIENIFQAWSEFKRGKRNRADVQIFERNLEDNLFSLNQELKYKAYQHGFYDSFYVYDPKIRHIHKAQVKDRIVHHLLYKYLYEVFDISFIYDSYSCRLDKGTHRAIRRLEKFARIVSRNYTRPCWALKCDIKKFFASVDHIVLLHLLEKRITNKDVLWLLSEIINSFHSEFGSSKGIPLGNLTSQVFANIYLNDLDQFVKHDQRIKYFLRYADDFLILSENKEKLVQYINPIEILLKEKLELELHPKKIIFRKLDWGIDFLGYVVLPHYCLPRTKTKRRIFNKVEGKVKSFQNEKISKTSLNQSIQSCLGYLDHANSYKLTQKLKNQVWFWLGESY